MYTEVHCLAVSSVMVSSSKGFPIMCSAGIFAVPYTLTIRYLYVKCNVSFVMFNGQLPVYFQKRYLHKICFSATIHSSLAPCPSGKGEVCKTFIHQFDSDRRLSFSYGSLLFNLYLIKPCVYFPTYDI